MAISVEGFTIEDFTRSGWRDVIDRVEKRSCVHYRAAFSVSGNDAREKGDDRIAAIFDLLAGLSSMFVDAQDPADPLKPMFQDSEGRTPIPRDYESAAEYLIEILPYINDAELKARVADVLWLCKRDFKAAREAVISYLAATYRDDQPEWHELVSIERALAIAAGTNQRDLVEQITNRIEELLSTCGATDPTPLPSKLMTLLQARNIGDPEKYAELSKTLAFAAQGRGDWYAARIYWDIQADWYKFGEDNDKILSARLRSAETFVQEAEERIVSAAGESYTAAVHFIESAIHALRKIGGQKERIDELHRRLLSYQPKAVAEMGAFSHEFDASEMVKAAIEAVSGKSLFDAIFGFALLGRTAKLETLRIQAKLQLQNSIRSLMTTNYKNGLGRTVARRDPPEPGETAAEADLRIEMYKCASLGQMIHVIGSVEPARAQILREHVIREEDLLAIVVQSPFVPAGREKFFARGLQMGFRGDFVASTHLLVPQVENSVRYVLEQRDIITSGLDDRGIQDERDLNRTLRLPEFSLPLTEVLGEDLLFDLRGLLIERYGSNLRNDIAHGLLDYDQFNTAPCAYLWWLTLHLCCVPVITALYSRAQDTSNEDSVSPTSDGNGDQTQEATE